MVVWNAKTKKCQKCDFSADFLNTLQRDKRAWVGAKKKKHAQKADIEGEKGAVLIDR